MESSPKIALCLFGSTGYKKSITRNEKGFSKLDEYEIEEPIESLVRHVVEPNNPDVFIHSWSKQHKNYLKTKLKPKEYIFQDYKLFAKDFDSRKNHLKSRFYSVKQSNNLKKKFEEKNKFNYDIVIHCRLDLIWFNDFQIRTDVKNKIYASHWNQSKRPNLLGPYDKSNYGTGIALMDAWFYSSSKNMNNFAKLYDKLNFLAFKTFKQHKDFIRRLKDLDLKNRFYLNSHHYAYAHAVQCNLKIDYDHYRGFDWEVYRNYIQDDWTNVI